MAKIEQLGHHLRIQRGAARRHPAQRVEELGDVSYPVLQQVADAAGVGRQQVSRVPFLDGATQISGPLTVSTDGGPAQLTVPGGPYALTADGDDGPQWVGISSGPTARRSIAVFSGGGPLRIEPAASRR